MKHGLPVGSRPDSLPWRWQKCRQQNVSASRSEDRVAAHQRRSCGRLPHQQRARAHAETAAREGFTVAATEGVNRPEPSIQEEEVSSNLACTWLAHRWCIQMRPMFPWLDRIWLHDWLVLDVLFFVCFPASKIDAVSPLNSPPCVGEVGGWRGIFQFMLMMIGVVCSVDMMPIFSLQGWHEICVEMMPNFSMHKSLLDSDIDESWKIVSKLFFLVDSCVVHILCIHVYPTAYIWCSGMLWKCVCFFSQVYMMF